MYMDIMSVNEFVISMHHFAVVSEPLSNPQRSRLSYNGVCMRWLLLPVSSRYCCFYTLGKKGCYTPIEDNKTNVDRTFVFPLGWNWHDMDPWFFPNEIRHYHGQTFNARSSGIVELQNHSIGGRSPKSIFTLWQLWINICIFFQTFFWLFEQCPVQPLWVLGMRCLHLQGLH